MDETFDALVLGGGAAGLSAALTLSRARRRVAVVHDGTPRNGPAQHVHAYLTGDGLPPAELLARGRAEVAGYGGTVVDGTVADVRRDGDTFRAALADGTVLRARRVVVATGLADTLPAVPGLAERWGRDVLHCPFCHGWEVRDAAVGILGAGALAVHQAVLWRGWTDRVTLFLHTADDPDDAAWEQLAALGVRVVDGRVGGLVVAGDRLTGVRLASGVEIPVDAVVTATTLHARLDGLEGLALPVEPVERAGHVLGTRVVAGPDGATGVPGVWAAGNVTDLMAQVQVAAAGGLTAGASVVADLAAEDAAAAVTRYRAEQAAPFSAAAERALADRLAGPGPRGLRRL